MPLSVLRPVAITPGKETDKDTAGDAASWHSVQRCHQTTLRANASSIVERRPSAAGRRYVTANGTCVTPERPTPTGREEPRHGARYPPAGGVGRSQ
ncbi:hypothetical protein KGM_201721 [Danaus plexippus plexippus]|uniref:Uncharacterized protein n=1 Tax=Danaus plexippus plexippus TaxID=278856 RepID=A0A212EVM5_DANPL|nr:hypothetical protein KGM_201721 [Danaus plexippus plexippus]